MRSTLFMLLLSLFLIGCNSQPDTLVTGDYDEQEMADAISKAKSTVDTFIQTLKSGDGEGFAVKAPISDGKNVEHFWVTNVAYKDGKFTGKIDNEPGMVSNVKVGQEWTIAKEDISDWMFIRNDKMHGNYTMRPLLKTLPENEAAIYRAMLAEP